MSYKARKFATFASLEEASRIVQQEFEAVEEQAELVDIAILQVLHAEPDKVLAGMVVYADGTDWDPEGGENGEGLYRRNVANSAWVFIG